MKVLQISAAYKPAIVYGGPTMSVSILSEELTKAGIAVTVYTTTANGSSELNVTPNKATKIDNVIVYYFKRITKDHTHFSPGLLQFLWKTINDFDVVHIHAWWNLVSLLSCFIALLKQKPVLLSPRGTLSPYSFTNRNIKSKKLIHRFLGKILLKRCHIHTTSGREYEAVQKLVSPLSINTIPNFVKLEDVNIKENSESDPSILKLLYLSRIEEKKGLDLLIKALRLINVPYHLTIAGDGNPDYINKLQNEAKILRVNEHITWAGFVDTDKFKLLQQQDLLVLPSHDENFGNVVIESLSTGTAVLISENVGLAKYIKKNKFGWICQSNPQSVAKHINNIGKQSAAALKDIRTNAPQIIYQDFTGTHLAQKYIDLYKKIIVAQNPNLEHH
ncbi:XrtY-associated glycosyltransferase XYAG1 [Mucilaginibacter segetis]|uniref:Glycosyltransferase n=1 Tax=Mucilaginibacter segetis TaxID=2793071 RepID=A0A934UL62_9SPHI|nr:glycosyltransferase [Mucilaginibacter segetis]MBK0378188.1 glycosyltransferase [Mucilaginibacter segetis]